MYVESTPNPRAYKIIIGSPILESGYYLFTPKDIEHCHTLEVIREILMLPGVESLLLTPDFITLSHQEDTPWTLLESIVLSILNFHFTAFPLNLETFHQPAPSTSLAMALPSELSWENVDPDLRQDIEAIVEDRIRPAIAADGGFLLLRGLDNGVLYIELKGACQGCSHSSVTLKEGIEKTLTHYIPDIKEVQLVEE